MKKLRLRRQPEPVRQTHVEASNDSYSFRRSRTLTGSMASDVVSAAESRGQLRSSRLREHDLRHHRRRLLVILAAALAGAWLLVQLIYGFIPFPAQVYVDNIVAADTTKTREYQSAVSGYLSANPLKRFYFAHNDVDMSAALTTTHPEIASARIERADNKLIASQSRLVITPKQPVAVWNISGTQLYVDEKGQSFKTNLGKAPTVSVIDRSGLSPQLGALASSKLIRFIGRLVTLVNTSNVGVVKTVELPPNSTREVVLRLQDADYPIRTHSDRDPAGQAADVASALRFIKEFEMQPEYLDVRVPSKAFYR